MRQDTTNLNYNQDSTTWFTCNTNHQLYIVDSVLSQMLGLLAKNKAILVGFSWDFYNVLGWNSPPTATDWPLDFSFGVPSWRATRCRPSQRWTMFPARVHVPGSSTESGSICYGTQHLNDLELWNFKSPESRCSAWYCAIDIVHHGFFTCWLGKMISPNATFMHDQKHIKLAFIAGRINLTLVDRAG